MLKNFLRKQAQSIVYQLLLYDLPKPYEHVGGNSWRSQLPNLSKNSAAADAHTRSTSLLGIFTKTSPSF